MSYNFVTDALNSTFKTAAVLVRKNQYVRFVFTIQFQTYRSFIRTGFLKFVDVLGFFEIVQIV